MVGVLVGDEDGGDLGQGFVHGVPVVSAQLAEGSLAAVQQQRAARAANRQTSPATRFLRRCKQEVDCLLGGWLLSSSFMTFVPFLWSPASEGRSCVPRDRT